MHQAILLTLLGLLSVSLWAQDPQLKGTVIGTELCVDYDAPAKH